MDGRILTGKEIAGIRDSMQLSIRQMARIMGISFVSLYNWEKDKKKVSDNVKLGAQKALFRYVDKQFSYFHSLSLMAKKSLKK